jgi:hypothetical protein
VLVLKDIGALLQIHYQRVLPLFKDRRELLDALEQRLRLPNRLLDDLLDRPQVGLDLDINCDLRFVHIGPVYNKQWKD